MIFEWDEDKRMATLASRGLDLVDAILFFDGRPVTIVPSSREGEERWKTTALIEGAISRSSGCGAAKRFGLSR